MRIAVVQWGRSGAGPLFARELAESLMEAGESVVVSYSTNGEEAQGFVDLGVPTFGLRTYADKRGALLGLPRLLRACIGLDRFLRRNRVDVVVVAMEHLWQGVAAPAFRLGGRRTLLCVHDATMHPGDYSLVEHRLRARERRHADGALVLSSHVRDALSATGQFPFERISSTVLPAFQVAPGSARTRVLPLSDVPVVGFFGRLSAYKGLDLGARAIAELRSRGTRVRFRVVGSGADETIASLTHPDDDVENRWVAPEEVIDVVDSFDVALLPYTEASQSGVLTYSMALGIPAVVTPIGGLEEQARESGGAVVAETTTPEGIADAVESLLQDAERYREVSETALAAAAGPFAWSRVAKDVGAAVRGITRR